MNMRGSGAAEIKEASRPKTRDRRLNSCGTTQIGAQRPLKALTRQTSGDFPARPPGSIRRAAHAPFPPPGALCAVLGTGTLPNLRFSGYYRYSMLFFGFCQVPQKLCALFRSAVPHARHERRAIRKTFKKRPAGFAFSCGDSSV